MKVVFGERLGHNESVTHGGLVWTQVAMVQGGIPAIGQVT